MKYHTVVRVLTEDETGCHTITSPRNDELALSPTYLSVGNKVDMHLEIKITWLVFIVLFDIEDTL